MTQKNTHQHTHNIRCVKKAGQNIFIFALFISLCTSMREQKISSIFSPLSNNSGRARLHLALVIQATKVSLCISYIHYTIKLNQKLQLRCKSALNSRRKTSTLIEATSFRLRFFLHFILNWIYVTILCVRMVFVFFLEFNKFVHSFYPVWLNIIYTYTFRCESTFQLIFDSPMAKW